MVHRCSALRGEAFPYLHTTHIWKVWSQGHTGSTQSHDTCHSCPVWPARSSLRSPRLLRGCCPSSYPSLSASPTAPLYCVTPTGSKLVFPSFSLRSLPHPFSLWLYAISRLPFQQKSLKVFCIAVSRYFSHTFSLTRSREALPPWSTQTALSRLPLAIILLNPQSALGPQCP